MMALLVSTENFLLSLFGFELVGMKNAKTRSGLLKFNLDTKIII